MQSKLILVTATILAAVSSFKIPPNQPNGLYYGYYDASGKEVIAAASSFPNGRFSAHHDASGKENPGFTVPPNQPNGLYSAHRDASGKEIHVLIALADTTSTDTTIA